MAELASQPINPNFLAQTNFKFVLKRAPNVVFFSYATEIPGINLEVATQSSPFILIPLPGTKMTYEDFSLTFRVDEDMKNYLEIYNWMNDLGFPDDFTGYPKLQAGDGVYSDATLTILTSKRNPNILVRFRDMFPVSMTKLPFNVEDSEINYQSCTVIFKYQRFYVEALPKSN